MIEARSVPISEVLRWYISGWRALSGHLPIMIFFGAIAYGIPAFLYWRGFPISVLAEILETLFGIGMIFAARACVKKEALPVSTLFRGFYDLKILKKIYPFLILSFLFSLASALTEVQQGSSMVFSILMISISMILAFIPYLMIFDGLRFLPALRLGVLGVLKNLHGYIVLFLGLGIALILLSFPAIFLQTAPITSEGGTSGMSGLDPKLLAYLIALGLLVFPWMSMIAFRSYEAIFIRGDATKPLRIENEA